MKDVLAYFGGGVLVMDVVDFFYGAFGGHSEPSFGLAYALGRALFQQ